MKKNNNIDYYSYIIKVLSIAKIGLIFSKDPYAIENYKEIQKISMEALENFSSSKIDKDNFFSRDVYPTPNISCRCVIFNDKEQILLVREREEEKFSLPGGWCDLFDSPIEAIKNECLQEAGCKIKNIELVGIMNKTILDLNDMNVPEYQITFKALIDGDIKEHTHETDLVKWFDPKSLPEMSKKCSLKQWKRSIDASLNNEIFCD